MKKTFIILFFSLMLMPFFERCTNLLDEKSTRYPVADVYYKTPDGFTSLVNACYPYLRTYYGQYNGFITNVLGTDIWLNGGDGPTNLGYYNANYAPSDATLWSVWSNFYLGITACNTVIGRGNDVVGMTTAKRDALVGEAYFLRAVYYHILVMNFGGVPLVTDEVTTIETTAIRASEKEVYDLVISDLLKAEQLLPATQTDYGRATKPAAQALLARVYLWNNKNLEAGTYAKKVINDYSFTLLPNYADLWKMSNQKNAEVIWAVQYTKDVKLDDIGNIGSALFLMRYDQYNITRDIANGRPFRHYMPSRYFLNLLQSNRTNDSRYSKCFTEVWYANKLVPSLPDMKLGDTALWVVPYSVPQAVKNAYAKKRTIFDIDYYFDSTSPNGELTKGARQVFPSLNKFLDPERAAIATLEGSRDFFVLRLAEMYLIAAEALMKQSKSDEGVTFFNAVRRRAAWPGKQTEMEITASQLTIDKILDERALELAGECVGRWADLKRTGKLLERVKLYNPDARPNIQEKHLLRPIPQNMIDRISNKSEFPQNPGY